MNGEQTRDAMVVALRRDLLGPLADPSGCYPGATPKLIVRGQSFGRPSEARTLFVADDGEEVLATDTPTSRYIVGALYPALLRAEEERELDAQQAAAADEADPEDAPEVAPRPPGRANLGEVESDDNDVPADRPGRPSSFGVSFVITDPAATLRLQVTGGRYEPFPYTVGGQARTGWHRILVEEHLDIPLPADPGAKKMTDEVICGPLKVELGVVARPVLNGQRIVTCYLVNRTGPGQTLAERVLFAARLAATLPPGSLAPYPDRDPDRSPEAASLRLLYAAAPVRAVGHGVDATAERTAEGDVIATEALPVAKVRGTTPNVADDTGPLQVDMDELARWEPAATRDVSRMISSYRRWIAGQIQRAEAMTDPHAATARAHLVVCMAFADDIEAGWRLVHDDPQARRCLRWASQAMAAQRRSYAAETRHVKLDDSGTVVSVDGIDPAEDYRPARWRPFQLAFMLANIGPVINPQHQRRGAVDVIWMPTGGGKTEAYLGLAALTMLYRRLGYTDGGGTAVIMRYTLRLLTAQQLQRAASLLCALEVLRRENRSELGAERFTIGAWLGRASTPNRRQDALAMLVRLARKARGAARPFLLTRCPACATEMGGLDGRGGVLGYGRQSTPSGDRMQASCPNPACAFHLARSSNAGLPVYEVDEDLYTKPPSFLVATVDKFAQLAWNERARVLFGLDESGRRVRRGPELVIQDELHMISGPLGSLVGLYEAALDQLCRHDGGSRPHVVAATATTRAYARQAAALYACSAGDVRLVPPPGLTVGDSFFATADQTAPPRVFVGVCATGVNRFANAQMRVIAGLSHAAASLLAQGAPVDPYWTDVTFFGSLRDLGQAKALIATDLRGYAYRLVRATGVRTGTQRPDGTRRAVRSVSDVELTSASSAEAAEALDKLTRRRDQRGCVDLALATSVIEVGVDVERLGLLTIVRQPKTAAQYIQVSGRVGRSPQDGPGLVVALLNPLAGRDMSHYERFTSVHARLYAAVEPASVTPFTDAALSRGLRGALASVIRQTRPRSSPGVHADDVARAAAASAGTAARAATIAGPAAEESIRALTGVALEELNTATAQQLPWGLAGGHGVQFLRPLEDPAPEANASWPVLTSLRSVDADAALRIDEDWLPAIGSPFMPSDDNTPDIDDQETVEDW
jgi:Helicase conserved C-terminal domain